MATPRKSKQRAWILIGSKHMDQPTIGGTLRDALKAAAERSLNHCSSIHVRQSKGFGAPGPEVLVIGKPRGCAVRVRRIDHNRFHEVVSAPLSQSLRKNAKRSTAKRLVYEWK